MHHATIQELPRIDENSAMPCNEWEEDQTEDEIHSSRRQKKRPKKGAELVESDDEEIETDQPPDDNPGRKWNGKADFELIKRWVTGGRAVMEPEDIERQMSKLLAISWTRAK